MATISKANRKANPNQTKNGKVRLGNFSNAKLTEMRDKATRPKDKHKIQNRINYNISRGIV